MSARSVARVLVGVLAVTVGLALGEGLRQYRSGAPSATSSPVTEPSSAVLSAAAVASPLGDCVQLANVPAAPAPPLAVQDQRDGTKRVTSAEGGYSIAVPAGWLVQPSIFTGWSAFAQAHITSYDPAAFGARGQAVPGMPSPELGIRIDIEDWANLAGEPPDRYAQNVVHNHPDGKSLLPGSFTMIAGARAYHAGILDEHRFQPASGPLEITRQTRLVWIVPVEQADRYLVIVATPGESDLAPIVENAVMHLSLTRPVASHMPVVHQRSEVLDRWLRDKSGPIPGRRAEAKLVGYAAAQAAVTGRDRVLRLERDPDELFWLVAVSGPNLGSGSFGVPLRVGSSPRPSPVPPAWMMYDTPATNDHGEMTSGGSSVNGIWPPAFDAAVDLCR